MWHIHCGGFHQASVYKARSELHGSEILRHNRKQRSSPGPEIDKQLIGIFLCHFFYDNPAKITLLAQIAAFPKYFIAYS